MATLTWLGHAAFRLETDRGKHVYIDPFLSENPSTPEAERTPERVDILAITHGHSDHVGDTVELSRRFPDADIVCQVELKKWLGKKGANVGGIPGLNKGGTQVIDGIAFTLTDAKHSSSDDETGQYLGESCGFVVTLESGVPVYFAGDTCVFGDMQLIRHLYEPQLAVLPIGDHFTMGPREAAVALDMLGRPRCVPCHWGTFPLLTGTPAALAALAEDADVVEIEPGDTVQV
jgi:L-ascorbate metabolism protein UlaG (beta-lactamase superfamily)